MTERAVTPVNADLWGSLRATTQARIGLGQVGHALPTKVELELRLAHQLAQDAVHEQLDINALCSTLLDAGFRSPQVVASQAPTRHEYLRRPDLGRRLAQNQLLRPSGADIGIVLADGLSPGALGLHAVALLVALHREISNQYTIAPLVIAREARVALGDDIATVTEVDTVIVIIGERPGLSVPHSLGAYITHKPRLDMTDAERNCVSNIHPPEGTSYDQAARAIVEAIKTARILGRSGVGDGSRIEVSEPKAAVPGPSSAPLRHQDSHDHHPNPLRAKEELNS